jgi:NADH-quinone oxidoreductase subunit C
MENVTERIGKALQNKFSDAIIKQELIVDFPTFTVKKEEILNVLTFLYDYEDYKFQFMTSLCGVHFPDNAKEEEFCVVYQLHDMVQNQRIRIKVYTSESDIKVPSVTSLFKTANWLERETYDFYGIQFTGHPNLTKILNMEDQPYFPMRKQYQVEDETREDKDDAMFGR